MNKIKFVCLHNSFNYGSMRSKSLRPFVIIEIENVISGSGLWTRVNQIDMWVGKLATFYRLLRPLTKLCFRCGFSCNVCWTTLNKTLDLTFNLFIAKLLLKLYKNHISHFLRSLPSEAVQDTIALKLQLRLESNLETFSSFPRFNTIKIFPKAS